MTQKLTQAVVDRLGPERAGETLYDSEVPGLRVRVGRRSISYRLSATINDGRSQAVTLTIGRTDGLSLREARDEARAVKLQLGRGVDPRRPRAEVPTVAEACEDYLAAAGLSARTLQFYEGAAGRLSPSVRRTVLSKLSPAQCSAEHTRLTGASGPYAANGSMRVLKAVYNHCARTHDLPPNPVSRGVRMNRERARDWSVPPEEMPTLWDRLEAMESPVTRALWTTLLLSGLRSAEARAMRWEHLDADGVLTVPRPKGGEERAFRTPLARFARDRIGELPQLNGYVFPSPSSASGHVEQLRRTPAFPYSPHAMRHTFRTFAIEAGVDFQTVVLLMNHSSPHVSFNYVTRANLLGPMRDAVEGVAEALLSYRNKPGAD